MSRDGEWDYLLAVGEAVERLHPGHQAAGREGVVSFLFWHPSQIAYTTGSMAAAPPEQGGSRQTRSAGRRGRPGHVMTLPCCTRLSGGTCTSQKRRYY